ncbi:hypothetical protein ACPPVT_07655 [Angustibacter sp. McL0619]
MAPGLDGLDLVLLIAITALVLAVPAIERVLERAIERKWPQ